MRRALTPESEFSCARGCSARREGCLKTDLGPRAVSSRGENLTSGLLFHNQAAVPCTLSAFRRFGAAGGLEAKIYCHQAWVSPRRRTGRARLDGIGEMPRRAATKSNGTCRSSFLDEHRRSSGACPGCDTAGGKERPAGCSVRESSAANAKQTRREVGGDEPLYPPDSGAAVTAQRRARRLRGHNGSVAARAPARAVGVRQCSGCRRPRHNRLGAGSRRGGQPYRPCRTSTNKPPVPQSPRKERGCPSFLSGSASSVLNGPQRWADGRPQAA